MHAPKAYLDRFPDLPPDRRIMAAMVAAVDDGVGEIVSALKATGQYDNTVLLFSSDNGPSTEARNWLDGTEDLYYGGSAGIFRGHKGSLFEGGIREPCILTCPARIPAGRVCHEPCAMVDVLPTFLALAGAEPPADRVIDGRDVLPVAAGAAPSPHRQLFWAYGDQLACRQGPWKLVLNGKLDFGRKGPDPVHLSNLADDPGERVNLRAERPDLVEQMTRDARAWLADVNAERGLA